MAARSSGALLPCLGAALLLAGCASEPLTRGVDASGRRIVLLLDSSTSMRENDPTRAADRGTELALALVGARDNLAVVTYARSADVVVPLQPAGDTAKRAALRRALRGIERNGVTDFAAAVTRAREVLEAGRSPPGSSVILLTDGVPYQRRRGRRLLGPADLGEEVARIAAKGWRIFAIALGEEASTPFLSGLVAETGGSVITAPRASDLVGAFEEVAVEALGYLRAERGGDEVEVVPHTRRLAWLGTWAGSGAVGGVTRDGEAVPGARVTRTPAKGEAPFGVALVEAPEPGRWAADLPGAGAVVTLLEPSFGLEFVEGAPPAEVIAGAAIPVAVTLGGDPEVVADARGRLRLRVAVTSDEGAPGVWVPLEPAGGARFEGQLVSPRVVEETGLRLVVEAEVAEADRPFVLRRSRSLTVRPPEGEVVEIPPLDLVVEPARVTRAGWAGARLEPVEVTVRGDLSRACTLTVAGQAPRQLAPGETVTLAVPCPDRGGALPLRAEAPDTPAWSGRVAVEVVRYRLRGPDVVELPATPAGIPARLAAPVTLERSDGAPAHLALEPSPLRSVQGGGELACALDEEAGALLAAPPAGLAPGIYRGRLRVRPEAPGLGPRELPLELEVLPPWEPPGLVTVSGDWGWASQPVELSWPSHAAVPLAVRPGPLRPVGGGPPIDPAYDIRVQPLDGWSGDRLGLAPRRLAYEVFLSSDLPAGVYEGAIEVAGEGAAPLAVPVRVEVER